jgi:hypothetical protein
MLTTQYLTLVAKCGYVATCGHIPVPATSVSGRNCEPVTIGLVTGSITRASGTFGGDARRRDAHRGSDIVNIVDSSCSILYLHQVINYISATLDSTFAYAFGRHPYFQNVAEQLDLHCSRRPLDLEDKI